MAAMMTGMVVTGMGAMVLISLMLFLADPVMAIGLLIFGILALAFIGMAGGTASGEEN